MLTWNDKNHDLCKPQCVLDGNSMQPLEVKTFRNFKSAAKAVQWQSACND